MIFKRLAITDFLKDVFVPLKRLVGEFERLFHLLRKRLHEK